VHEKDAPSLITTRRWRYSIAVPIAGDRNESSVVTYGVVKPRPETPSGRSCGNGIARAHPEELGRFNLGRAWLVLLSFRPQTG